MAANDEHPAELNMPLKACSETSDSSPSLLETYQTEFKKPLPAYSALSDSSRSISDDSESQKPASSPARRKSTWKLTVYRYWLKEFCSWFISLLAIIGLVIFAKSYNGQSVPEWPYHITINSIVALFSVFARTFMLAPVLESLGQLKWLRFTREYHQLSDFHSYDRASRGVWGSTKFLRFLLKDPIATFGAILVIISLAIDPFSQQIVRYPLRQVSLGEAYTMSCREYSDYNTVFVEASKSPSLQMLASIYGSIYGGQLQTPDHCSSGNCTWKADFRSLAICSQCTDLAPTLNVTQKHSSMDFSPRCVAESVEYDSGSGDMYTFFEMTGHNVLSNTGSAPAGLIVNMTIVRNAMNPSSCDSLEAYRCALSFCVNTYHLAVNEGVPTESIVSSYIKEGVTKWYDNPGDLVLTPPPDKMVPHENNTFTVYEATMQAFLQGMPDLFGKGSVSEGDIFPQFYGQSDAASDPLRAFYEAASIPDFVNKLATSMTGAMRTPIVRSKYSTDMGSSTLNRINGTSWQTEPYVDVKWSWITLLAGVNVLTLLFVITVIYINSRKGLPAWKNTALSVLRAHADTEIAPLLDSVTEAPEMEQISRDKNVRLRFDSSRAATFASGY